MKKVALRFVVLSVLVAGFGFYWTQTSWCTDCETQRWNAFIAANDNYTTTFNSWYRDQPISCLSSCQASCQQTCGAIADPQQRQDCFTACNANLPNCTSNCRQTRNNDFIAARDALGSAGSEPCPVNPDYCDAARIAIQQCNAQYAAHFENPMIDPTTGGYDSEWYNMVIFESFTCRSASGIDNCQ